MLLSFDFENSSNENHNVVFSSNQHGQSSRNLLSNLDDNDLSMSLASKAVESHDQSFLHPEVVILAPFALLGFGALLRHTTRSLPIPYTMQLLIVGSILGFLLRNENFDNTFFQSVLVLGNMDPHVMLHIFLPPLIFESAASLEWHLFTKAKGYIFTLAGPGLMLASGLTGMMISFLLKDSTEFSDVVIGPQCFSNKWSPQAGLMLGVILSATDPVAVVALLKELGCKASLSTAIEGEKVIYVY